MGGAAGAPAAGVGGLAGAGAGVLGGAGGVSPCTGGEPAAVGGTDVAASPGVGVDGETAPPSAAGLAGASDDPSSGAPLVSSIMKVCLQTQPEGIDPMTSSAICITSHRNLSTIREIVGESSSRRSSMPSAVARSSQSVKVRNPKRQTRGQLLADHFGVRARRAGKDIEDNLVQGSRQRQLLRGLRLKSGNWEFEVGSLSRGECNNAASNYRFTPTSDCSECVGMS